MRNNPLIKAAIAVVVVFGCALGEAHAQVRFDASTGSVTGGRLRAGREVTIRVEGMNPLCYHYQATIAPVVATTPGLSNFVAAFTSQKPPLTLTLTGDLNPALPAPVVGATPLPNKAAGLGTFERRIATARRSIDSLDVTRERLEHVVAVASDACGRDAEVDALLSKWESTRDSVRTAYQTMEPRIAEVAATLASAHASIDRAEGDSIAEQNQMISTRESLRATRIISALRDAQSALTPLIPAIEQAARQRVLELRPVNTHETEAFDLTIRRSPRVAVPGVKPDTIPQTTRLGVRRNGRFFLSTGVLITHLNRRDFARVNRPYTIRDTVGGAVLGYADSTYSTYASQDQGAHDYFSPAVQFNIGLGRLSEKVEDCTDGISVMTSFGVAGRTTNETLRLEPFLGASLVLADRFVITGGGHWTREEVLRITQPGEMDTDVEQRRVPTAITDRDAIGTRGILRPFLSVSIKP